MSIAQPDYRLVTPGNPKRERFYRLVNKRVPRALDALEMVGRLANPSYQYTPEEAAKVVQALREQLDDVERRLARTKGQKKQFSLD